MWSVCAGMGGQGSTWFTWTEKRNGECEWVDEGTVPEPALEAFERVRMLDSSDTEHDDDDSSDDSDCGDDDECVPCCP